MMGKWAEAPSPSSLFSSATIQTTNTESFDKATIERSSDSSSTLDKSNNIIAAASSLAPAPQPVDEAATKNLLRKLDFHLLPFLVLIYLLCFLDRTNIGNARLAGLEEDLKMKDPQYNIALAIFFPFYILAEIPSNMMMQKHGPIIWLTAIMFSWGLVMTCMGFVQNFSGLVVCRIFLGISEASVYPGISFFISRWYRRHETCFRMALVFSSVTAAGAFGGLLASAISRMSGVAGKAGWSWIFILEGLLTLCVATFGIRGIHDYPATATFLTNAERVEILRRLTANSNALSNDFDIKYVLQAFRSYRIWIQMFIGLGIFTPFYSISLFLPDIIKNLGYTNDAAQLMTVPPHVVACFCTIAASYAADRTKVRGAFILGFALLAIVGFALLISNEIPHVQYAGTFVAAAGVFPMMPLAGAWNSNNIGGGLKRATGIAMQISFGNIGGILSSFIYLSKDAPRYIQGHAILMGMLAMVMLLVTFIRDDYSRENCRRDRLCLEKGIPVGDWTEEMKAEGRELGDEALFFRYMI